MPATIVGDEVGVATAVGVRVGEPDDDAGVDCPQPITRTINAGIAKCLSFDIVELVPEFRLIGQHRCSLLDMCPDLRSECRSTYPELERR